MTRRAHRRRFTALALLAGAAILAVTAACGQEDDPTATPQATATPQPTEAPSGDPTATPSEDPTATPEPDPTATENPGGAPTATPEPDPTATPPPSGDGPSGSIRIAITSVEAPSGTPRYCSSNCTEGMVAMSIFETAYRTVAGDISGAQPLEHVLSTGFEVDPNLEYVDIELREGVPFHDDWGEMTAEDFAFSLNDANSAVTPDSISGQAGELAATFAETEVLDEYTVRINFSVFDSRWERFRLSNFEESIGITSKAVFDEYGADGMREHIIGTGPYRVVEWTQDDRTVLEAVSDHWRQTPSVNQITFIEVLEASSQAAMLETGDVVAGPAALKDWGALQEEGMQPLSGTGFESFTSIAFAGNYWEWESARSGEVLDRERDTTKPWIGDPFEDGDTFDPDTPSMQSSLKVRQALSHAIDREGINASILDGRGQPAYFAYQPANDSEFFDEDWTTPYDLDMAKQLLDEAGHGDGFTMDVWTGPSQTALAAEIMEGLSGFWQAELGIEVDLIRTEYVAFRPSLVQRTNTTPFLSCGDGSSTNNPIAAPRGFTMSSFSDGGYGVGMEIPFASEAFGNTATEMDEQKRIETNLEFIDQSIEWALCVGIVSSPGYSLYDTGQIESWTALPMSNSVINNMNNFETITLK